MESYKSLIQYVEPTQVTKFPPDPVADIWFRVRFKRFEAKQLKEKMLQKSREEIINKSIGVVFKNQE